MVTAYPRTLGNLGNNPSLSNFGFEFLKVNQFPTIDRTVLKNSDDGFVVVPVVYKSRQSYTPNYFSIFTVSIYLKHFFCPSKSSSNCLTNRSRQTGLGEPPPAQRAPSTSPHAPSHPPPTPPTPATTTA